MWRKFSSWSFIVDELNLYQMSTKFVNLNNGTEESRDNVQVKNNLSLTHTIYGQLRGFNASVQQLLGTYISKSYKSFAQLGETPLYSQSTVDLCQPTQINFVYRAKNIFLK